MRASTAWRFSKLLALLLVCKVTLGVLWEYPRYLPPDFNSDFLLGRQPYFWGAYAGAFYVHLFAGPASLGLGTLLLSERLRRAAPAWHRRLGRMQVAGILLLLTPSGLWMAWYAATGAVAGVGLGALAVATAAGALLGWRAAVRRDFVAHRRWMERTYLLLASAVVIRLIGGAAEVARWDAVWLYPLAVWISWTAPLAAYEFMLRRRPRTA